MNHTSPPLHRPQTPKKTNTLIKKGGDKKEEEDFEVVSKNQRIDYLEQEVGHLSQSIEDTSTTLHANTHALLSLKFILQKLVVAICELPAQYIIFYSSISLVFSTLPLNRALLFLR
jgi:hypothetical protein